MITWKLKSAATGLLALGILAGCGSMPEAAPTATTAPPTAGPGADEAVSTPATPNEGSLTFGDLAERVGAAWPAVESYRVTFTGTALSGLPSSSTPVARPAATPGATPVARPRETYTTVREVSQPDRQRQTVTGLGADDHEAIAIGDELFVRGPVVERIAPGTPESSWVQVDPTTLPEGALLLNLLGGLPEIPGAPLATLPGRLRDQEVREAESVEHDGRNCRVYAAADTVPATGMRVDYTIAIDEDDIPCFVETGAGGITQGRDDYTDINAALDIEPPPSATPVTVPPALATPVAHD